jgi:tripartite-type tricarboxylate transporter receptor subunit TctC
MKSNRIAHLVAAAVALASAGASPSLAQQGGYYEGKTLRILIGFGAGGGNDGWARAVAENIVKYLPGKATAIIQHMPGAGSARLGNYLFTAAPKDGTVIGVISRGLAFEPLLGGEGAKIAVCAVRADAPAQSLAELKTREVVFGATGSGADTNIYPKFLANILGLKMKVVRGYQGSSEIFLAMERGEVQGICISSETVLRHNAYKSGAFRILFQAGLAADPGLPGVSNVLDTVTDAKDRAAVSLFLRRVEAGRPFVAPPGVAPERVAELRGAFEKAVADPAFKAEIEKSRLGDIVFMPGAKLAELIAEAYRAPPDVVERTKAALAGDN